MFAVLGFNNTIACNIVYAFMFHFLNSMLKLLIVQFPLQFLLILFDCLFHYLIDF